MKASDAATVAEIKDLASYSMEVPTLATASHTFLGLLCQELGLDPPANYSAKEMGRARSELSVGGIKGLLVTQMLRNSSLDDLRFLRDFETKSSPASAVVSDSS